MLALLLALALPVARASDATFVAPALLAPVATEWPAGLSPEAAPAEVVLELLVSEQGRVEEVVVMRGEEPFSSAALAAVKGLMLTPATEGGVPVAVRIPLTLRYAPPPRAIEGRVRALGGGVELPGGLVVGAGELSATPDATGRFVFHGLPEGKVALTVRGEGVQAPALEVEVQRGSVATVELWVAPEGPDPGLVGTYRSGRAEVARRTLGAEELRALPGTLGDPIRAVLNLPGTVRAPLETGWLLVRGGNPGDSAVYVDGVRLPMAYHLGGFTSVLHPAFIERVDFVPGGGGARYGRALAGVVDVTTREASPLAEVRAGANLVFAGAYANVPFASGAVSASVRRSYLDAVLVPVLPATAASSIPRFWDWQARLDLADTGSLFAFGFVDEMSAQSSSGRVVEVEIAAQRLQGRAERPLGEQSLRVVPYLAWERVAVTVEDWEQRQSREQFGGGLRAEVVDTGRGDWAVSGGLDAEAHSVAVVSNEVGRVVPVAMPDVWTDVRLGTDTSAVLGVRVDSLFAGDQPVRAALSPRLSLRHEWSPRVRMEVEAGGYHQPPAWELLLGPPEGATLELDESWSASLGGAWGSGPADLSGEVWARTMPVLAGVELDGSIDEGEGQAYGLDLMLRLRHGPLLAMARYGYSRSERRDDPDEDWRPANYDQPHSAGLVAAVDLGRAWSLSTRWRYGSGFPTGDGPREVFDALLNQSVTVTPIDGRMEAFHSLDLKLAKRFHFRTWRLDAWLDVQNVYNHRVPEPVITGLADVYFDELGFGLMTLPLFGVEAQWGGDPRRP